MELRRTIEPHLENHAYLQLGEDDRRRFQRLHEGRRVADAGNRAVVNPPVHEIGKRNDRALLEFRNAIGIEQLVEIRFDILLAGNLAVVDVAVGRVRGQRNDEDPAMRTRDRTRIGVLRGSFSRLFLNDCRAAADDGLVGGDEGNIDVLFGVVLPGKAAGVEDEVVTLSLPAFEFHLRAAVHPRDIQHFPVDVKRVRAFVQQIPQKVGGEVVGVGHLLWRKVVAEVLVAPAPSLESDSILAGSLQALLDNVVGQVRQPVQFRHQARPTAFADADDRDARVIYVMQFEFPLGEKPRYARRSQGTRGAATEDRDFPQGFNSGCHDLPLPLFK